MICRASYVALGFFPFTCRFLEGVMIHVLGGLDRRAYGEAPVTGSQAVVFCRLGGHGQKKTPSNSRQTQKPAFKPVQVAA